MLPKCNATEAMFSKIQLDF
uniref:Uncharacterized protein n=1 Tax=Anguilla anguilla TaxID=7936 RepID=A0A0E9WD87_ANGAN